jgi:hypothetical protein
MKVAIVYESLFGTTQTVAEAIAEGAREANPGADVEVVPVAEARLGNLDSVDILVVGGPTHMRGMSTGLSRRKGVEAQVQAGAKKGREVTTEAGAEGPGVRNWFKDLPKATKGSQAAAFDTRIGARMAGGAANGIARRLRRHNYDLVSGPEGFIVEDTEGPLRSGERDRAKEWGADLVRQPAML